MKKLLGLLVVCSLILSAFNVITVNAANDNLIPLVGRLDLSEDFSGTTYDARIVPVVSPEGSGTCDASSGELKMRSGDDGTNSSVGAFVYVNADKSGISEGMYVTQIKLTRADTLPIVMVQVADANSRPILTYTWGNSATYGRMKYSTTQGVDGKSDIKKNQVDTKSSVVLTLKYDLSTMQFWVWFDSTMVVNGGWPRNKGANCFASIYAYTEKSTGVEIGMDDIKFYTPMTDEQAVKADFDAITFDSVFAPSVLSDNILKKDVNLYTSGANRTAITWTSTNEKYINTKGNVTFADTLEPANPEVTLTATVSSGEVSMTKSFDVKVAKENEVYSHILPYKEMHYRNDFSENNITDANYVLTQNGGSITIADNALNITRSENTGMTIADIYPDENKTALTGDIYASFVLRKPNNGRVICNVQSSGNKDYFRIIWSETGRVSVTCKTSTTVSGDKNYHFEGYTDTELRVDALLKTQQKKFDLWLNGTKQLTDRAARVSNIICSLTNFRFYLEGTDFGTVTVDDIKVYTKKSDGIVVSEDNKTAAYVYYYGVPEDCKSTAMIIAVYDSPNELADVQIGYLDGNVATASVTELKSGQKVKYMVFKDMGNIVPLVKCIEKIVE